MAYRKGLVLQFGLVTCIVSIDGAVGKADSMTSVCCGTTGHEHVPTPITQDVHCASCGSVSRSDLKKAREVGSGQYKVVDQQEVATVRDASQGATKKMMSLTIHDATEVRGATLQGDQTYYVAPDGAAQIGAYSVLLDAVMRNPDKAFLTRYTPASTVGTFQLKAFNGQLVLERRTDPESVKPATFVDAVEPDAGIQAQMDMVIEQMTTTFDPAAYENSYAKALDELVSSKEATEGVVAEKPGRTEKTVANSGVVDLSAQLAAMLAAPMTETKAEQAKSPATRRKSA